MTELTAEQIDQKMLTFALKYADEWTDATEHEAHKLYQSFIPERKIVWFLISGKSDKDFLSPFEVYDMVVAVAYDKKTDRISGVVFDYADTITALHSKDV